MARFLQPTASQERAHLAWFARKPAAVADIGRRFDPWTLYRTRDDLWPTLLVIGVMEYDCGRGPLVSVRLPNDENGEVYVHDVDPDSLCESAAMVPPEFIQTLARLGGSH